MRLRKYLFIKAQEGHAWGGSEELWGSAAEHLARRGNEVRVSVNEWKERVPQVERLRSAGCQVLYHTYRMPTFLTRQIQKIFRPQDFFFKHAREASRGADLVVISQGANFDGLGWMEVVRALGLRYVVIAQSAVVYWWPDDALAERLAAGYEKAEATFFVSQANLELSRQQFGSELRNASVVRNPYNVSYEARPPWPGNCEETLELACVGRLDVISKAQDVLLQVLALPHWRERRVQVSLIGTGPNERGLRRMAEQLGLKNVRFEGQQGDIEGIWRRHHALVLPSRFEGMPLTVVEAMLCGRPSIVSDVGGNRDLVRHGINGFMAKAPTVELLDDAMNQSWESRLRLEEMGQVAASDARRFVSADPGKDFADQLERVAGEQAA